MNPVQQGQTPVGATAPPNIVYVPAIYNTAPPPPQAPCVDMLPWERQAKKEAEKAQKAQILKQKRAEDVAATKKKKGFLSAVTAAVKDVAYQAEAALDSGVKSATNAYTNHVGKSAANRFASHFPQYGPSEPLLWRANGKVISAGCPIDGEAFISENYLSFFGWYLDTKSQPGVTLRHQILVCVPIVSIMCLQQAVPQYGSDKTAAPTLVPHNPFDANAEAPSALMVFCNSRQLHLFYQFSNHKDFFNVLDHKWREKVNTNALLQMQSMPLQQQQQQMQQQQQQQYMPEMPPPSYEQVVASAPPMEDDEQQTSLYPNLQ